MREEILREFLAGRLGAWQLRRAIGEAPPPSVRFEPMPEPFALLPRHLLALCEAVLARELDAPLLPPLARGMQSSARFHVARRDPDGRVVEEVLVAWSSDERRLRDPEDVLFFRDWLVARRRPARFD